MDHSPISGLRRIFSNSSPVYGVGTLLLTWVHQHQPLVLVHCTQCQIERVSSFRLVDLHYATSLMAIPSRLTGCYLMSSDLSLEKHVSGVSAACFFPSRANSSCPAVIGCGVSSNTRPCVCDFSRWLLQRRIGRVAEGHNRQVAACDELCCPRR